jgi:hypothetical protein
VVIDNEGSLADSDEEAVTNDEITVAGSEEEEIEAATNDETVYSEEEAEAVTNDEVTMAGSEEEETSELGELVW